MTNCNIFTIICLNALKSLNDYHAFKNIFAVI